MIEITKKVKLSVDRTAVHQRIDGFGVNLNARYWDGGNLRPVIDYLIDGLGATLFRVDAYGLATWVDPDDTRGLAAFCPAGYRAAYEDAAFTDAAALCLYLNERGIEPYITVSGRVPACLCEADGKTLRDVPRYADMLADYAAWMRGNGVRFSLFGPLNEPDFGPPEGPAVSPEGYAAVLRALASALDARGLSDIRFVVPEQGNFNLSYLNVLLADEAVRARIGALGMHMYGDFPVSSVPDLAQSNGIAHCWMTEFGDLDQSTTREDATAFTSARRLMQLLCEGMNGALFWDAFDNYHDHDAQWTSFGLLTNSWHSFTPKKRAFALRHFFRFIRPGFVRIDASSPDPSIRVAAFCDPEGDGITLVGINDTNEGAYLDLDLGYYGGEGLRYRAFDAYRTCDTEDCATVTTPVIKVQNHSCIGFEMTALPHSIFTISNVPVPRG